MRTLKIIEHISVDGVIQVLGDDGEFPYADWTAPYRTPAGGDAVPLCGGNPATVIRARQHARDAFRHPIHHVQGRRAFEVRIFQLP
jgi:hypothetical protein